MRQPPRDHVPVSPDLTRIRQNSRLWSLALLGSWLLFALAAAFFAFGV